MKRIAFNIPDELYSDKGYLLIPVSEDSVPRAVVFSSDRANQVWGEEKICEQAYICLADVAIYCCYPEYRKLLRKETTL